MDEPRHIRGNTERPLLIQRITPILLWAALVWLRCATAPPARKAFEGRRFDSARLLTLEALSEDSLNTGHWILLSRIYAEMDSSQEAEQALDRAEELGADSASVNDLRADIMEQRAQSALTASDSAAAAEAYRALLDVRESEKARVFLAEYAESRGELGEALAHMNLLMQTSDNPFTYQNRTNLLETRVRTGLDELDSARQAFLAENWRLSERHFSRALEAYPGLSEAAYGLKLSQGRRAYKRGVPDALDAAARSLRGAIEIFPDSAEAHFWMARTLEMRYPTKPGKALAYYQQAYELDPGGPHAALCRRKIRELSEKKRKYDRFFGRSS